MADSITSKLGLTQPEVGASADTWGGKLNADLEIIDKAIQYERLVKSVAGGVTVNLTATEASYQVLEFTGALTANIDVTIPANPERQYIVVNNTTGAFTLTFKVLAGSGVAVPQASNRAVFNNGTNVAFCIVDSSNTATTATTATNVNGGTASVTSLNNTGNTTLGDAGTDTTTVNSQVSANGSVGTLGQFLQSRGANLSPSWTDKIISSNSITASGTSIDFTTIPAGAKKITVLFNGVSLSGTAQLIVQLGVGGVAETTGYAGTIENANSGAVGGTNQTTGFFVTNSSVAAFNYSGSCTIFNHSGNTWISASILTTGAANGVQITWGAFIKTLAGVANLVRVTSSNGTDTFDGGSFSILIE